MIGVGAVVPWRGIRVGLWSALSMEYYRILLSRARGDALFGRPPVLLQYLTISWGDWVVPYGAAEEKEGNLLEKGV
jgi:hypothetical protein